MSRIILEPYSVQHLIDSIVEREPNVFAIAMQVGYTSRVPNTHSCPRKGEINFIQHPGKPKRYNGWAGRIWLVLEQDAQKKLRVFPSDIMKKYYIYTGTGGYGHYMSPVFDRHNENYSYDVRFYQDDFPTIHMHAVLEGNLEDIDGTYNHYISSGKNYRGKQ